MRRVSPDSTPEVARPARPATRARQDLRRDVLAADSRPTMSTNDRNSDGLPLDINGLVRQCAWCRRVADVHGHYRLISDTMVVGASHGCCEACAIRYLGGEPPLARRVA